MATTVPSGGETTNPNAQLSATSATASTVGGAGINGASASGSGQAASTAADGVAATAASAASGEPQFCILTALEATSNGPCKQAISCLCSKSIVKEMVDLALINA